MNFSYDDRPTYDPVAVAPIREELKSVGVRELLTPGDVEAALARPGTALLVVNSVCGCAAGNARPGVMLALQNKVIPDDLTTVFAGMEKAAVNRARAAMPEIAPSSPSIALFKDGKLVFALQRHQIENQTARMVAESLVQAFNAHCARPGPSIPREQFEKLVPIQMCGSSIPFSS